MHLSTDPADVTRKKGTSEMKNLYQSVLAEISLAAGVASMLAAPYIAAQENARPPIKWGTPTGTALTPSPVAPLMTPPVMQSPLPAPTRLPSALPTTPLSPAANPATVTAVKAPAITNATGQNIYKLDEVFSRPDSDVLTGSDGKPITVGEVKRRYAASVAPLAEKYKKQMNAAPVRMPPRIKQTTVAGKVKLAGTSFKTVDQNVVNELQQLSAEELIRRAPATTGTAGASGAAQLLAAPSKNNNMVDLRSAAEKLAASRQEVPCGRMLGLIPGSKNTRFFLSTVNRTKQEFWVDMDADERILKLSGCFPASGQVQIRGPFPNGAINAEIILWQEKVIVARLPKITGAADGALTLSIIARDGTATNTRPGLFYAKRATTRLDRNQIRLDGPCKTNFQGANINGFNGVHVGLTDKSKDPTWNISPPFGSSLCGGSNRNDLVPSGRDIVSVLGLRPDFDVSWQLRFWQGNASVSELSRNVFAFDWNKDFQRWNEYTWGIKTGSYVVAYLHYAFALDVTGPEGIDPIGQAARPPQPETGQ
jgi:hypothetical protein